MMVEAEKPPVLKIEDLHGIKEVILEKTIKIDTKEFTVRFKRLTYGQVVALDTIPPEETGRYVSNVVFAASIDPKFSKLKDVDDLGLAGFVRHYSRLILNETGKDPFL